MSNDATAPEEHIEAQPEEPPIAATPQPVSSKPGFANRHGVQEVTLPSRGLLYDGAIPGGSVLISSITHKEEKIMSSSASSTDAKMNMLFTQTCDLHGLSPLDLVSEDRFFLLMQLRALSYGNTYTFEYKCSQCGHQFRQQLNLIKDMEESTIADDFSEPILVHLPVAGVELGLHLLRGRDELWIEQTEKKLENSAQEFVGDPSYTLWTSKLIRTVNGQPINDFQAMEFVDNLTPRDTAAIRRAMDDHKFGYSGRVDIECRKCGFIHHDTRLPFDAREFFRASDGPGRSVL